MSGAASGAPAAAARRPQLARHLRNVAGPLRQDTGALGPGRVVAQDVAVFLELRAAAGGGSDHGVEGPRPLPGVDIAAQDGLVRASHVVREGAATPGPSGHRHLAAESGQEANRGLVHPWRQHLLGASREQADAHPALAGGPVRAGSIGPGRRRRAPGRQGDHGLQATAEEPEQRCRQGGAEQRQAQAPGMGHERGDQPAQPAFAARATASRFDMNARVVDEAHVVDAGRAGRGTGKAGEAAVDMPHGGGIGRAVGLQHLLDHVDAPARAVALVPQQQIGGAGRQAQAAMDAGLEDAVRLPELGIRQTREIKPCLHRRSPGARD